MILKENNNANEINKKRKNFIMEDISDVPCHYKTLLALIISK